MKKVRYYKLKSITYGKLIIAIIILIVLLYSAFFEFYVKETKISNANSQTVLKEYAVNSTKATEMELENALDYVVYQSKVFSGFDDIHSKEALAMLAKIKNSDVFAIMRLTTPDGKSRDYINTEINIADRDYFKSAMEGTPTISDRIISKSSGEEEIIFCAPIYKGGEVVGTLHGSYDLDRLSEIIDNSCFNGESRAAIITIKGEKIYSSHPNIFSDESQYTNFINKMKMSEFTGDTTYSSFIYSITNNQPVFFQYTIDGEAEVAYVTPVKINNWFFVQTVPIQFFTENSHNTIKNVMWLLAEDALVILIFLLIIYFLVNKNVKAANNFARRTSMLINNLSCGVLELQTDKDFSIEYISDSMFSLFGYSREDAELYKNKLKIYFTVIIDPEYYEKFKNAIDSAVNKHEIIHLECKAFSKTKESFWVAVDGGMIDRDNKSGPVLQLTFTDITNLKNTVFRIDKDRTRYLKLLSMNNDFCFEYYFEQDSIYFSDNASKILLCPLEITGFSKYLKDKDELTAKNIEQCGIFNRDNFASEKSNSSKVQLLCIDRKYHWFKIDLTPVNDANGKINSIIGRATDITNEKVVTDSIIEASRTDLMTGLLNKVTVETEIKYHLNYNLDDSKNALIIIDIDNFKTINDTFGHTVGDEAIKDISNLLKDTFRKSDILGRIGGDEFLIFMRKISDRDMLEEKIQALLHDFYDISIGEDYEITCSAGVVFMKNCKNVNYKEVFELADKNMYNSKLRGKNCYTISDWGENGCDLTD